VSYGFPTINFCNPEVHYETPSISFCSALRLRLDVADSLHRKLLYEFLFGLCQSNISPGLHKAHIGFHFLYKKNTSMCKNFGSKK